MTSILIYKTRLGLDTLSNYLTSILIYKTDLELDTPTHIQRLFSGGHSQSQLKQTVTNCICSIYFW